MRPHQAAHLGISAEKVGIHGGLEHGQSHFSLFPSLTHPRGRPGDGNCIWGYFTMLTRGRKSRQENQIGPFADMPKGVIGYVWLFLDLDQEGDLSVQGFSGSIFKQDHC
jgi:hypothetical protein